MLDSIHYLKNRVCMWIYLINHSGNVIANRPWQTKFVMRNKKRCPGSSKSVSAIKTKVKRKWKKEKEEEKERDRESKEKKSKNKHTSLAKDGEGHTR